MRFSSLHEWLQWQEQLHPAEIELGLERIQKVWSKLHSEPFKCPVITVAGTNGKGSCIALLQSIYQSAGYQVASYTSPHLFDYNERICLDGQPVSDELIVNAFESIDQARGDISLTYFEFGTLAALTIFAQSQLDVILLEVGLGGRLDAVNIIDPDVSIITSIDLDHQAWLGDSREQIACEKAGILRANKPAILADPAIPNVVDEYAEQLGSKIYRINQQYSYSLGEGQWTWTAESKTRSGLPVPALPGKQQIQNAAAVIMASECLQAQLPVNQQAIRDGLLSASLKGRFELDNSNGDVTTIYDVAHNPAAASQLAKTLNSYAGNRKIHAVFSILGDKDIEGVIVPFIDMIQRWYIAPLQSARSTDIHQLQKVFNKYSLEPDQHMTVANAMNAAKNRAFPGEIILVFGSFYTVTEAVAEQRSEAV